MMARTRIARLLGGYRDRPPVDIDAVKATLVKLSQMVVDFAEIAELDINPLIADAAGVLALDARIVVKPAAGKATARLAIQPYPAELAHRITLESGLTALVRAIRPEDKPLLLDLVARSSPEDIRLRFFAPLKTIQSGMAARLSQIDYSREMALVAVATDPDTAKDAVLGVARFIADPNFETAEYAIMVRSDQKGRGLGYELMTELIAYARSRGLKTIHGDVLRENVTMLQMAGELGFVQADTDSPEVVRVTIDLTKPVPPQPAST
jgi:acetyltransferase